jgi:methionine synthase I (cobalamin-dependent)
MTALLDVLRSGRVLLMDGAMGTELQKVGLEPPENGMMWNVLYPEKVEAVHRAYLAAGAEVLLTNTFLMWACPCRHCTWYGRPWEYLASWRAALDRVGPQAAFRVAAIGPVAGPPVMEEFDRLDEVRAPHDGIPLPDAILLETCSTPRVRLALARLRKQTTCPLFLSLAFTKDANRRLVTFSGHSPEWFARRAADYGAVALGVNCGKDVGMDEVIEVVRRYRQVTDLPLFARPNAGTPVRRGNRWVYSHTPQEMAERLPELLEAGVCMVGGCCGTTPEHIAAFRKVVNTWNARHAAVKKVR